MPVAGLKQLRVVVEKLDDPPDSLTDDQIRTDVELKLRMAGITVLPDASGDLTAFVYVLVGTDRASGIYTIALELMQLTRLVRDPTSGLYYPATWQPNAFGRTYSARQIRGRLADQTDRFVNAWLEVNPK
jgi:hypothetical protein